MLMGKRRTALRNKSLGRRLAFIAGCINAGGFMVVHQYTSHMTGILSLAADSIALNEWKAALAMLFYILCFVSGAATTAIIVLIAKNYHLHSQYALPLVMEAMLLMVFGIFHGGRLHSHLDISSIIALLCYVMGLQNAVITKISNMTIRTTHVTGMSTDIGIEIGRIIYARRTGNRMNISPNKERMLLHLSIIAMFLAGGITGAYCFKYVGFISVIPIAGYLIYMALLPVRRDVRIRQYVKLRALRHLQ